MVTGEDICLSRISNDNSSQRTNEHAQIHPYENGSRPTSELQFTRARHAIKYGKV